MTHTRRMTVIALSLIMIIAAGSALDAKKKDKGPKGKAMVTNEQIAGLWFIRRTADDSTVAPFTFNTDGTCRISDGVSETLWKWTITGNKVTCCAQDKQGKPVYRWRYDTKTGTMTSEIYQGKPDSGYRLVKPE